MIEAPDRFIGGHAAGAAQAALAAADPAAAALWQAELRAVCPHPGSRRSGLCTSGDPVELGVVFPAGELRLTCDPAPGASAAWRLAAATALCASHLAPSHAEEVERLRRWGADRGRWGAWVGSRRRGGAIRRKLYVEVAEEAPWREWWPARVLDAVPSRTLVPVMAGLDGESGVVEMYCRTPPVHPELLAAILRAAGLPPLARELAAEVAGLTGCAVRRELPGSDQGVSLAFGPDGAAVALTWYAHARSLLGPSPRVREAYLARAAARGWPVDGYAAASAADPEGQTPLHALSGFGVRRDGAMAVSITFAPRAPGEP